MILDRLRGILLFIVSIELLTHGAWRFGQDIRRDDSGVVPLAFPLLAGPGSITSVIILYQTRGIITTILSITIVISLTYIILPFVSPIYRVLGRRGSMVVTRVFAVLVAAFAVQYVVEGIMQIYNVLASSQVNNPSHRRHEMVYTIFVFCSKSSFDN